MGESEQPNNKNEVGSTHKTVSVWEKAESATKMVSAIALPIVLAVGGWWLQSSITNQSIGKDYVSLAISVLEKPTKDMDNELRDWAVDMLNDYAPRKFHKDTVDKLKSGTIDLPTLKDVLSGTSGTTIAISQDLLAVVGQNDTIEIFNIKSGKFISRLVGPADEVTALAFNQDGKFLYSGSADRRLAKWDVASKQRIFNPEFNASVIGIAVAPDGQRIVVGLDNDEFLTLDANSGTTLATVTLRK
jgi:WD40 repeat protein